MAFFDAASGSQTSSGSQFGSNNLSGATTTQVIPGAVESGLNNLYASNIQGLLGGKGLSFFGQGFPNLYQPQGREADLLSQIAGLSQQSRYNPQMQGGLDVIRQLLGLSTGGGSGPNPLRDIGGNDFLGGQSISRSLADAIRADPSIGVGYGATLPSIPSPTQPFQGTSLPTMQQLLQAAMQGPNSLETGGLETMRGRTDPQALTAAAEQYMRDIVAPSATARSQAGGLGGMKGGALQESLAREGSRLALPIAQMIQQASGEFGGAQMGLGGALESRRAGLASLVEQMRQGQVQERSGLASQLFGMGQQDTRLGEMSLLRGGAQAAGAGRMGALQDFLRQQGLATAYTPRVPFTPSMTTSTSQSQQGATSGGASEQGAATKDFTVGNLVSPLTSILAASVLNPQGVSGVINALRSLLGSGGGDASALGVSDVLGGAYGPVNNAAAYDYGGLLDTVGNAGSLFGPGEYSSAVDLLGGVY